MKFHTCHMPSPHDIHEFIQNTPHPVRLDDVLRAMEISRRHKKTVLSQLEKLAADGCILRLTGGRWADSRQVHTITGILSIQKSGTGIVTPLRTEKTHKIADIFIPATWLEKAWHGDIVEVAIIPGTTRQANLPGRNPEGRILHVIRRGVSELAVTPVLRHRERQASGRIMHLLPKGFRPKGIICRPTDPRYPILFDVDISALRTPPQAGELIMIEPGEALSDTIWNARAKESLGIEDAVSVQERLTRLNHAIPLDFPPDAAAEAEELATARPVPKAETTVFGGAQRADLRHLCFVTIDGADAKDFDDAVCVEKHQNMVWLWVAIADVSLYVKPRSGLDREAFTRGTSCYFPTSVTPMLPEILSNDLCSLKPEEDRPVMAVRLTCRKDGSVGSFVFGPALIRSRRRLTYTQVQTVLDGKECKEIPLEVSQMLMLAAPLAQHMITRRIQRGALDLDLPEAEFIFDDNGRVSGIRCRERLFAHRLIEAFMIAANEAAANFLSMKGIPFPLRAHPAPDPERLDALFNVLNETSLAKDLTFTASPAAVQACLNAAAQTPQAQLVARLVLRAMMQARYIPGPADPADALHFGLASTAYCHFTSPIRRYPDLLVHRAIKLALNVPNSAVVPAGKKMLAVCDQCNTRERAAQDAEREVTRRLACLLLEPHTGEIFQGTVSGVTDFGIFVEPANLPVDGMIRLESMHDDWYVLDEKRQCLTGMHTGRSIALGQPVTVRLAAVNVGRLEIDFVLEEKNSRINKKSFPQYHTDAPSARIGKKRSRSNEKYSRHSNGLHISSQERGTSRSRSRTGTSSKTHTAQRRRNK